MLRPRTGDGELSERIRALLDEAVAEVRPREADPVRKVVRRVRTRRHQLLAGAGLAVLALLGVGAMAVRPPAVEPAAPPSTAAMAEPAVPVVENGEIRAGLTTLPVPTGWEVVRQDQPACQTSPRTVFVGVRVAPGGRCGGDRPLIQVVGYTEQVRYADLGPHGQLILPGGQPGWVPTGQLGLFREKAGSGYQAVELALPWSGAKITFFMSGSQLREIFPTVRTAPVAPTGLVFPASVRAANLRLPGLSFQAQSLSAPSPARQLDQPDQLARLHGLLAGLTEVVPGDAGCATGQMTRMDLVDAHNRIQETIYFSTDPGCAQATSSLGGRVRITPDLLAELARIFPEIRRAS
ncbi:hypothetical protein GCM10009687_02060 [Asanoa iriomotensis]|uniref:Uncharacterized protein n=1 Tax=Asanoa iriomotensis TaxID=234613 RepID=A0ABQ4BZ77_9ACTN|nr:hypothetical protein Air01nite_19230 [Asanoa iriomotensis]